MWSHHQRLITNRRAASTARSSSKPRCPTCSPRRLGSTALACSASTLVRRPSISISGRNVADRADVDVGATSHVESTASSSACTTTAYRLPACSWPRASRGALRRKTSPRTQRLHVAQHVNGFGSVILVSSQHVGFSAQAGLRMTRSRLDKCIAHGARHRRTVGSQLVEREPRIIIRTKSDRCGHATNCRTNCRTYPADRSSTCSHLIRDVLPGQHPPPRAECSTRARTSTLGTDGIRH